MANSHSTAEPSQPRSFSKADEPPLFHFGLRQLFLFVAALSGLFTALALTQGLTSLVILLMAIVVAMHVFATTLGSHLRTRADRYLVFEEADLLPIESIATVSERSERLAVVRSSPPFPWHARGATVLPWLRRTVITAIACGGVIGAAYLAATIGYRTSPAGIIVGGLSVAVLFGWAAFLFGSFYGVFRDGIRKANAHELNDLRSHHPTSLATTQSGARHV